MDDVTRPGSAAQRRSGSRSLSAFQAADGDSSDDSPPTLAGDSNDEAGDEEEESDVQELPRRGPDPRASRHSARAEANKPVNYSRKHHPQDGRLPGHQKKARQLNRALKGRRRGR